MIAVRVEPKNPWVLVTILIHWHLSLCPTGFEAAFSLMTNAMVSEVATRTLAVISNGLAIVTGASNLLLVEVEVKSKSKVFFF